MRELTVAEFLGQEPMPNNALVFSERANKRVVGST